MSTYSGDASLWINTDRSEYPSDQAVNIYVGINETGAGNSSNFIHKVSLEVMSKTSNNVMYRSAHLVDKHYTKFVFLPTESGTFNATAVTFVGSSMVSASTLFKVADLFHTQTAYMIYLSLGFLAALLILISIGIRNIALDEILRFIFLSGIVGCILVAFLVSDKQFGIRSPIGIVLKSSDASFTWVLNIGGGPPSFTGSPGYATGIQIPIYVLVIGLVGGYLRYLYKTSRLMTDNELIKDAK
jgi:hypothetical protein